MASSELLSFIEKLVERKVSQEQIKALLMKKGGWESAEIDEAFSELEKKSSSKLKQDGDHKRKVVYESPLVGTLIRPDDDSESDIKVNSTDKKSPSAKTVGVHIPANSRVDKEVQKEAATSPQADQVNEAASTQPAMTDALETHAHKEKQSSTKPAQSTDAAPETPKEIQEAAEQAEEAMQKNQSKKRIALIAFVLIVIALVGAVFAYYFFGRSVTASDVLQQALIESHKVYSATNAGTLAATFSTVSKATTTEQTKETALTLDADYNFTYDASQTVNPIGEGSVFLTLSGLANDVPVEMRAAVDVKLIDHTLYVRFNDAKNVPLPEAILDFRRTWIAIDLDDVADMLSTDLNEVLVERDRISKEASVDAEKIFEDEVFRTFLDRILVQGTDIEVRGVPAYTFHLVLTDTDIDIVKRIAAEFFDLYGDEMLAGNVDPRAVAAAIRGGQMDSLFMDLQNADAMIAVGKGDSLPRKLTLLTAAQNVQFLSSTVDYGVEIDHETYGFNEPVLVQINGDMITLDLLLEQMGLMPVIVVPAQPTTTEDASEITTVTF